MPPRIAIPVPHSTDHEYGERAISQYERAVTLSGGEPVRIPLDHSVAELKNLIATCDAVLLPGSNADIDPSRFKQEKSLQTAAADLRREEVDDLLIEDAYANRKPVLGICYGLQSLNVFRKGSLIQHIPNFLPEATRTRVNHEAGKKVPIAHTVKIDPNSVLATVLDGQKPALSESKGLRSEIRGPRSDVRTPLIVPVNSSHHQSADEIGEGLRIVARCVEDGIIEAVESTSPDHFVLAVQWHPERSVEDDEPSRRLFSAFIEATKQNGTHNS